MELSVIIVNYNVRYFLELCLQSVQDALININAEIIVVDNASSDDSCEMIKDKFSSVKLIKNKYNLGFSKANNLGVKTAQGEFILILNPDTVVANNTIKRILNFAKNQSNFGILGVKLIDGKGNFLPESKRGIPTPRASFYKMLGLTSNTSNTYYARHLKDNEDGEVDVLTGAFMLMKQNVFSEVDGFDERYFMYGEDIDLSYRVLKKGYKNYYCGNAEVIHYKGECTIKDAQRLYNFYNAMEIFYDTHFKINKLYDFAMKLGIKFWKLLNFLGLKQDVNSVTSFKNLLYLGDDKLVFNKLKSLNMAKSIYQSVNIDEVQEYINKNNIKEVIFDNNFLSYQNITSSISNFKKGKLTFKIHPKNTNYIIGSNSSDSRGEIIMLD